MRTEWTSAVFAMNDCQRSWFCSIQASIAFAASIWFGTSSVPAMYWIAAFASSMILNSDSGTGGACCHCRGLTPDGVVVDDRARGVVHLSRIELTGAKIWG
jgi:hypothetical protein